MYQAIEAISKGGVIQPLEPIQFEENEHLVILRLSKSWKPLENTEIAKDWKKLAGVLKSSPNLNDDPLLIQQSMRNEWD
ncbi:MAG: antitoxin family protein [Methylomonas sp.]|jgi:predicted DNA-binding antitoxin AbrB/MazE fold protein